MQVLKSHMERSYQEHPAFVINAPSWEVAEGPLIFNKAYSLVKKTGFMLDCKSLEALRHDCLWSLNGVFSCMQAQVNDKFESCFLNELNVECARLLVGEFAWYARSPKFGFVRLENVHTQAVALRMQTHRYFFSQLSTGVVSELRDLAEKDVNQFRSSAVAGELTRADLSVNSGGTVRSIRAVLNREFKALGVLDAVSAYTGRKTRVGGLALELSVPQATWWKNSISGLERAPRTLYAHLDETISCPKAIVYLSDVTEQNGPTSCYPRAYEAMQLNPLQELIGRVIGTVGTLPDSPLKDYYAKQYHQSMNSENFRRHFMRLPESLRFNSHLGWDVLPGSELENQLAENERKMTGPAGTFIAFDGARLLHRGGLMQQGERVALQVVFSDLTFTERAVGKVKRMLS
jgi:hypothetical protein